MLIDWFGIARLLSVTGGSMGGMQASNGRFHIPIAGFRDPIACTTRAQRAADRVQRVGGRPSWPTRTGTYGEYYDGKPPDAAAWRWHAWWATSRS